MTSMCVQPHAAPCRTGCPVSSNRTAGISRFQPRRVFFMCTYASNICMARVCVGGLTTEQKHGGALLVSCCGVRICNPRPPPPGIGGRECNRLAAEA